MSQSDEVEARLRELILSLEIGPGERLTERWAEALLGVSRTPIRAALLRLEAEGLICREGRGWIAAPINLSEIEQLFVYREVLEIAAVRIAVARREDPAVASLIGRLQSFETTDSSSNNQDVGTAFHLGLAELAGNDFIRAGLADALQRLARVRWLDTGGGSQGWREHLEILSAIQLGEVDTAVQLVQQHLSKSRDRLRKVLEESRLSIRARRQLSGK